VAHQRAFILGMSGWFGALPRASTSAAARDPPGASGSCDPPKRCFASLRISRPCHCSSTKAINSTGKSVQRPQGRPQPQRPARCQLQRGGIYITDAHEKGSKGAAAQAAQNKGKLASPARSTSASSASSVGVREVAVMTRQFATLQRSRHPPRRVPQRPHRPSREPRPSSPSSPPSKTRSTRAPPSPPPSPSTPRSSPTSTST
jgi:hypothetical protein